MATKKVRILKHVGDPRSGVILAPGSLADLPDVWADRYIAKGSAELVKPSEPAPAKAKKKGK
jgi:hypothetical protein